MWVQFLAVFFLLLPSACVRCLISGRVGSWVELGPSRDTLRRLTLAVVRRNGSPLKLHQLFLVFSIQPIFEGVVSSWRTHFRHLTQYCQWPTETNPKFATVVRLKSTVAGCIIEIRFVIFSAAEDELPSNQPLLAGSSPLKVGSTM